MAKKKREKKPSRLSTWWSGLDDPQRGAIRRGVVWGVVTALALIGATAGLMRLERSVQRATAPKAVRLVLDNAPSWMPPALTGQICEELLGGTGADRIRVDDFLDSSLTKVIYQRAAANSWVRRVRSVNKSLSDDGQTGVVHVVADFRQPFAHVMPYEPVHGRIYEGVVDVAGVRLPDDQVPRYGRTINGVTRYYLSAADAPPGAWPIRYICVYGVSEPPPPVGQVWPGEDVSDGLRLVRLFQTRPYWNEISAVDVRNHKGRVYSDRAPFRVTAQVRRPTGVAMTTILMSRFPEDDADYVVAPAASIRQLDSFYADHGRIAGVKETLDLRYDYMHESIN